MRAVIIDDEGRARQLLLSMLADHCPGVEVVASCDDLPNGVRSIRKQQPDLVFLDIEMPGHSGLELLDFFNDEEVRFGIVFTTAYDKYAIDAFRMSAVDYLLKPISAEELVKAVERARKKQSAERPDYRLLRHNLSGDRTVKLAVPNINGIRFVELDQILYLKGDRAYTEIHLRGKEVVVASRNLRHFEQVLERDSRFFRCHRSYIVRVGSVRELVKSQGGYLVLEEGMEISVASDRIPELMERLSA